jgi:hypothetical protein
MKNNYLSKTHELSPSRRTPFISSAKFVIGIGSGVLGLIGKAIRGAVGLLVNRPENARTNGALPVNNLDSMQQKSDL